MPEQFLRDRFTAALEYALAHHAAQWRKGTRIPYAAHLLAVAARVLEMETSSEDEAIAALLHDVVEDGGGLEAAHEIRGRFGADVERIVLACSDTWEEPKPPWRERKEAYIASIAHKRPDELRVSLADKVHNARAILLDYRTHGEALWSRFKAGEGDSVRWYYRELAAAFQARREELGPGGAVAADELSGIVAGLDHAAAQPR